MMSTDLPMPDVANIAEAMIAHWQHTITDQQFDNYNKRKKKGEAPIACRSSASGACKEYLGRHLYEASSTSSRRRGIDCDHDCDSRFDFDFSRITRTTAMT